MLPAHASAGGSLGVAGVYVTAGLFGVAECSPTAALGAADAARRRARLPYGVEKKVSKHRGELGTGAIEGVAGPEAAHNAAVGGVVALRTGRGQARGGRGVRHAGRLGVGPPNGHSVGLN